ncbi:hypothetical protein BGZ51_007804 [Haplosporangium sp. Z 767]|nr:hypothetical protein BGZ51_007804 [Haplosporangium sp. Z 767]
MDGETIVTFMKDSHYRDILPHRIEYRHDVILSVVLDGQGLEYGAYSNTLNQPSLFPGVSGNGSSNTPSIHTLLRNLTGCSALPIAQQQQTSISQLMSIVQRQQEGTTSNRIVRSTGGAISNSFQHKDQLHMYLQTVAAVQASQNSQIAWIKDTMFEGFKSVSEKMEKEKARLEAIHQIQERTLDMQQQTLDRLAVIENRAQSILTQNYELHEYTIPRLFIVLPKASRRRDRFIKPFMDQFRLFFLCECGTHTMTEGSKTPHEIHLAKHEGYDIDQPTEFFDKYGSYVLAMMEMIKFGITTASLVVTPLAISAMSETIQKYMDFASKNFGDLVDQTISCIQARQSSPDSAIQESDDGSGLDGQTVLEGADLRQLESYLKVKDEGRVLGNLYRIVTHDGNVKWVCIDHYRDNYHESATKRLREIVEANGGSFEQELSKIDTTLTSKMIATPFYDVLVKARGVQELSIKLDWDVTMDDLRTFASVVTKANIVHLTLDGSSFKGPRLDFVNRGRRFEPIVQLMSSGRIQGMHLQGISDLYKRIGKPTTTTVSRLRTLSIDTNFRLREPDELAAFKKVLRHCGPLIELDIVTHYPSDLLAVVTDITLSLSSLKTVSMHTDVCDIVVSLMKGRIRTVVATMYPDANFRLLADRFIFNGQLTKLCLEAGKFDSRKLNEIIEGNSELSEIEVVGALTSYIDIIDKIIDTRKKIHTKARVLSPSRLVLRPPTNMSKIDATVVTMDLEFKNEVDVSDATMNVQMSVVSPGPDLEQSALGALFKHYGWSIETLTTSRHFRDSHAEDLLKAIESRGSNLTTLALNTSLLTARGLHNMVQVIDRSANLIHLSFDFKELHQGRRQDQALIFLEKFGARMTGLNLHGRQDSGLWMEIIAQRFSLRHLWPNLITFGIEYWGKCSTSTTECIESMVSSATKQPRSDSRTHPNPSQLSKSWTPLKEISLCFMEVIGPMEWQGIIKELDFTSLETLNIESANFGMEHLQSLVNSIPDNGAAVPLRTLTVAKTKLTNLDRNEALWEELRTKAPDLKIVVEKEE